MLQRSYLEKPHNAIYDVNDKLLFNDQSITGVTGAVFSPKGRLAITTSKQIRVTHQPLNGSHADSVPSAGRPLTAPADQISFVYEGPKGVLVAAYNCGGACVHLYKSDIEKGTLTCPAYLDLPKVCRAWITVDAA